MDSHDTKDIPQKLDEFVPIDLSYESLKTTEKWMFSKYLYAEISIQRLKIELTCKTKSPKISKTIIFHNWTFDRKDILQKFQMSLHLLI